MCFKWKSSQTVFVPEVLLNGKALTWKAEQKYLGVILTDSLVDDSDIKRQMRRIYCSGITVIRRLRACSNNVKKPSYMYLVLIVLGFTVLIFGVYIRQVLTSVLRFLLIMFLDIFLVLKVYAVFLVFLF